MTEHVFVGDFKALEGKKRCERQFHRLEMECERELAQPVPALHPAMSITFMGLFILNLSLLYRITGKERYLKGAEAWMRAVSSYPHWGNDKKMDDVDLSASWVLFGLSLGYDWLQDKLGDEVRAECLSAIKRHAGILYQYKKRTEGHGWSTEYWQNHNWINMTGIAAAGYVLQRHGEGGQEYIQDSEADFEEVFARLPDDGSDYEGVSYWRYGAMWLFVYAYLRRNETGRDFFKESGFLKHTFSYRLYQSSPDLSQQLNFGDTHDRHSCHSACVYYLAAHEYGDGHAQRMGDLATGPFLQDEMALSKVHPGILPEAGLEFIWYDPSVQRRDFSALPLEKVFPDLGLATVRSGWGKDDRVFSFKCGCPGGEKQWSQGWLLNREKGWSCMSLSHHHPDNLSYIMACGSRYFSCDDGYNRAIMPYHHNVLLVDGRLTDAEGVGDVFLASCKMRLQEDPQYRPEEAYRGLFFDCGRQGKFRCFGGETHMIYPEELEMQKVERWCFLSDDLERIVLVDVLESGREHTYTVLCNTDEKGRRVADNLYAYPESGIHYQVVGSQPLDYAQDEHVVSSIMTPQEPEKVTRVVMQNLLCSNTVKAQRLVVAECITPYGLDCAISWDGSGFLLDDGKERCRFVVGKDFVSCT